MNLSIAHVKFESLNVSSTNVRNKYWIDIITNCINLRKLDIGYCQNITNKFFEDAYKIKKNVIIIII